MCSNKEIIECSYFDISVDTIYLYDSGFLFNSNNEFCTSNYANYKNTTKIRKAKTKTDSFGCTETCLYL